MKNAPFYSLLPKLFFCVFLLNLTFSNVQSQPKVNITVEPNVWGVADTVDIEKVLGSAATELFSDVTAVSNISILVKPSKDGVPRTLFTKGPNGEFIVLLATRDRYWSQYSYQFSHELNHVLTMNKADRQTANQWFEEALGETASMFVMRKMAISWKTNAPYPHWNSYSASLSQYIEDLIAKEERKLPPNQTLAQWFTENENSMRIDPYQRQKDALIGNQLLPYFEAYPAGWDAVTYINQTKPTDGQTFQEYLDNWFNYAPEKHHDFIKKIANLFEIKVNKHSTNLRKK